MSRKATSTDERLEKRQPESNQRVVIMAQWRRNEGGQTWWWLDNGQRAVGQDASQTSSRRWPNKAVGVARQLIADREREKRPPSGHGRWLWLPHRRRPNKYVEVDGQRTDSERQRRWRNSWDEEKEERRRRRSKKKTHAQTDKNGGKKKDLN